jgi:hypothetical protein
VITVGTRHHFHPSTMEKRYEHSRD